MADKYLNGNGVHILWNKMKDYSEKKFPAIQTQGNWKYRIYDDGTFEAWYKATSQTLTITAGSGNLYRSELKTLSMPTGITDEGTVDIQHADVNAAHNNYPAWGMLGSLSGANINFYAMSGGSRSSSPNYIITAYAFGVIT